MAGAAKALFDELTNRQLSELQHAELQNEASFERVAVSDLNLKTSCYKGLEFDDSIFTRVDLSEGKWSHLELMVVQFENCSLANAQFNDGQWKNMWCSKSRLTGLNLASSRLEDVSFVGCKLDLAVLHDLKCSQTVFERCDLREADFQGATLREVVFRNCDLRAARFSAATLERVDWRGSSVAGMSIEPEALRGTTIDPSQMLEFAAMFGLDVRVLDDQEN